MAHQIYQEHSPGIQMKHLIQMINFCTRHILHLLLLLSGGLKAQAIKEKTLCLSQNYIFTCLFRPIIKKHLSVQQIKSLYLIKVFASKRK